MTGVSIPRLRRVRFKDGRTITVIHPRRDPSLTDCFKQVLSKAMDQTSPFGIQAFAILAWDGRGYCFVDYRVADGSALVAAQIPQLAKDALLAELAVRWTTE